MNEMNHIELISDSLLDNFCLNNEYLNKNEKDTLIIMLLENELKED